MADKRMKRSSRIRATSIREVVLGLLARHSMSGYDIRRRLGGLPWLVDSPSFGSLYPGLHTLLADGLVTVEVIPNESRPPRKIYSITEAGRMALQEWAGQPVQPDSSLKEFVMRLVLAGSLSPTGLNDYLEQRLEQVAAIQPELREAVTAASDNGDLGQRLTLDYGLALAEAEMAWLDHTLSQLSERSKAVGSPAA